MSIDQWTPPTDTAPKTLELSQLRQLVSLSEKNCLTQLTTQLSESEISGLSRAMHADHEQWQQTAAALDEAALKHLIKALAIAEIQLPDCTVGQNSPAIAVNALLKSRGGKLSTDELLWLRNHSNNRFIPNGSLL